MFDSVMEVYLLEIEGILVIALLQIIGYVIWDEQAESRSEIVRRANSVI